MVESGFTKNDRLEINTKMARDPKMWRGVSFAHEMEKILDAIDRGSIENMFMVLRENPHISNNMEYFHMESGTPNGINDGRWTWNTMCFTRKLPKIFIDEDFIL